MIIGIRELASDLAKETGIKKGDAVKILNAFFKILFRRLAYSMPGDEIRLKGIGKFTIAELKPSKANFSDDIFLGWRKKIYFKTFPSIKKYLSLPRGWRKDNLNPE